MHYVKFLGNGAVAMNLALYKKANRNFFAPRCAPKKAQWIDWVLRGVVLGKIIDGEPWVDLNWFASRQILEACEDLELRLKAIELLS